LLTYFLKRNTISSKEIRSEKKNCAWIFKNNVTCIT
jgi:hypothetical protein